MPASAETKDAIATARTALRTAVAAVQAARDLWDAEAPTNPDMNGAFPFSDYCPLAPAAAGAYFGEVDKALRR